MTTKSMINEYKFSFRKALTSDVPFMTCMLLEAAAASGSFIKNDQLANFPETAKYINDWPKDSETGVIAVSESGIEAGAAWIRIFPESDAAPSSPELTIAVSYRFRRMGIATNLLLQLCKMAGEQGFQKLSLGVHYKNKAAINLYQSQGWVTYKTYGDYLMMCYTIL